MQTRLTRPIVSGQFLPLWYLSKGILRTSPILPTMGAKGDSVDSWSLSLLKMVAMTAALSLDGLLWTVALFSQCAKTLTLFERHVQAVQFLEQGLC